MEREQWWEGKITKRKLVHSYIRVMTVGCGDVLGDTQQATDFFHELAHKSGISVANDL